MAAHLALLAVSPLFLFPFFAPGVVAEVVLWLCAFALAWVFMEPSRHHDEMLHDARERVAASVMRDPLFWVMALVTILAALRWINNGVEPAFDTENMRWHLREPLFVALPCAATGFGKFEFAITLSAWIILMGVRHSLGKLARLSFITTSAFLAGIAAVIVIAVAAFGNQAALEAAKALLKSPSFVGPVFGVYALAAVVSLAGAIEAKWRRFGWIPALAIGGTFAGAFVFSPVASVLLMAAAALLTAFICMGWLGSVSRVVNVMRFFAIMFIGIALAVVLVVCAAPDAIVEPRIAEIKALALFPKKYFDIRETLSNVALRTWEDAKWLGSGLGTFPAQMRFVATKADWRVIGFARSSAFSAWWTLIAERGIIGAMTFSIPLGFLFFTFFRRLPGVIARRFFLPGCWLGLVVLAVAVTENFFDVSFLRPEALLAVAAFMAISGGSLPPLKKQGDSSGEGDD